jgi:hypothetical protein
MGKLQNEELESETSNENEHEFKKVTRSTPQIRRRASCVKTEARLRGAVQAAPSGKLTNITLCAQSIQLSDSRDASSGHTSINLMNKVIDLHIFFPLHDLF